MTPEEVDLEIASALKNYIAVLTDIKNKRGKEQGRLIAVAPPPDEETRNLRYARLPLAEIIPEYLSTCKEPQTVSQITTAFTKAGRDFESSNPIHTVRMALKKLLVSNDDVFHAGWAKWYLRTKCSKAKLEKYLSANTKFGRGGRSKREHVKRTTDGINRRRAQGLSWGRTKKATPELIEKAKEMLRNGDTLKEVCLTLDVSTPVLYENGVRALVLRKEGQRLRESELALGDNSEGKNIVRFAKS